VLGQASGSGKQFTVANDAVVIWQCGYKPCVTGWWLHGKAATVAHSAMQLGGYNGKLATVTSCAAGGCMVRRLLWHTLLCTVCSLVAIMASWLL